MQVVKDPNGDFFQVSKKGSQVLRHIRESQNRAAMREKFWELAGTKLGNLLKINKEAEKIEEAITEKAADGVERLRKEVEDEVDYKAES